MAALLGGDEGLEDSRCQITVDARPAIGDQEDQTVVGDVGVHPDLHVGWCFGPGWRFMRGLGAVAEQDRQDTSQGHALGPHVLAAGQIYPGQRHSCRGSRFAHDLRQRRTLPHLVYGTREGKQRLDDRVHLREPLVDLAGEPLQLVCVVGLGHERGEAHHPVQRVLDLVSDAQGQLRQSGQAIQAIHLPPKVHDLGAVLDQDQLTAVRQRHPLQPEAGDPGLELALGLLSQRQTRGGGQACKPVSLLVAPRHLAFSVRHQHAHRQRAEDHLPLQQRPLELRVGLGQLQIYGCSPCL